MIQLSYEAHKAVQQLTTTIPASQTMTVRVKCTIIKLIRRRESSSNMEETIPGTFEFINGHGGFLNEDFRLFSTDNKNGKLTYQRFLNGYPTFNTQNLNEIQVTWGKKGVFDYQRSLLKSSVQLNSEESKNLPTAESVRSALANDSNIDFEKVTNLAVGYEMDDKPDKDDIEVQRNSEFTPQWYVEYDGNWYVYKDGRLE